MSNRYAVSRSRRTHPGCTGLRYHVGHICLRIVRYRPSGPKATAGTVWSQTCVQLPLGAEIGRPRILQGPKKSAVLNVEGVYWPLTSDKGPFRAAGVHSPADSRQEIYLG